MHAWFDSQSRISVTYLTDEAQEAEAIQVLNAIYDMRENQPGNQVELMAKVSHALAMLYYLLHDVNKVPALHTSSSMKKSYQ